MCADSMSVDALKSLSSTLAATHRVKWGPVGMPPYLFGLVIQNRTQSLVSQSSGAKRCKL